MIEWLKDEIAQGQTKVMEADASTAETQEHVMIGKFAHHSPQDASGFAASARCVRSGGKRSQPKGKAFFMRQHALPPKHDPHDRARPAEPVCD